EGPGRARCRSAPGRRRCFEEIEARGAVLVARHRGVVLHPEIVDGCSRTDHQALDAFVRVLTRLAFGQRCRLRCWPSLAASPADKSAQVDTGELGDEEHRDDGETATADADRGSTTAPAFANVAARDVRV